jgi:flagellar capping protein FliD
METVRERYNQQFGAMESAVATMKSTENTITNMMEAWKGSMRK